VYSRLSKSSLAAVALAVMFTATLAACTATTTASTTTTSVPTPHSSPVAKDYGTLMAACLRAEGWHAKAAAGASFTVALSGKRSGLVADEQACRTTLGFASPGKPSAQQVAAYYEAQLKVRTCLTAHGVAVAAPQSKQNFIATFGTAAEWNPYASVGAMTNAQWDHFNTVCPQATP
jgi:hypothetical protein